MVLYLGFLVKGGQISTRRKNKILNKAREIYLSLILTKEIENSRFITYLIVRAFDKKFYETPNIVYREF